MYSLYRRDKVKNCDIDYNILYAFDLPWVRADKRGRRCCSAPSLQPSRTGTESGWLPKRRRLSRIRVFCSPLLAFPLLNIQTISSTQCVQNIISTLYNERLKCLRLRWADWLDLPFFGIHPKKLAGTTAKKKLKLRSSLCDPSPHLAAPDTHSRDQIKFFSTSTCLQVTWHSSSGPEYWVRAGELDRD